MQALETGSAGTSMLEAYARLPDSCRHEPYYSTGRPDTQRFGNTEEAAAPWLASACPWEEVRHSGYYSGFPDSDAAGQYAALRTCPQTSFAQNLSGYRFYFVGDSLVRQWVQSFLCRLRRSYSVVLDNSTWGLPHSRAWGDCLMFSKTSPPLRHCTMLDGCVIFERDLRVCYTKHPDGAEATHGCMLDLMTTWIWSRLGGWMKKHGVGERTVLALAHGMHSKCFEHNARQFYKFAPFHMTKMRKDVSTASSRAPLPKWKINIIYKELEASHFPTLSGVYNVSMKRGGWHCKPVDQNDPLPPLRVLEQQIVLKAVRSLASTRVLETFDQDVRYGAALHATYAKVPSKSRPVDCLHWMMPGIPDDWTEKMLRLLSEDWNATAPKFFLKLPRAKSKIRFAPPLGT